MSNMKIVALIGPSSCGKTTTLNLVYEELISSATIASPRKKEGGDPNDFSVILTYKNLRIAIFSMGDFSKGVIGAIKWANKEECDYLIVACNDRFVRPFREMAKYENTQTRKEKLVDKTMFANTNKNIAQQILIELE